MLPQKYRIPKKDLIGLAREGKRFASENFTLTIARNHVDIPRFAIRIGVMFHKRAVVRNRVKRLFHESMRSILPTLTNPVDILCSIKRMSPTETRQGITEMLEKELKKIL